MSEHDAQAALIQWARYSEVRYPELRLLFAVPNGGPRSRRAGAMLKAEGLRAGVPDLCLPVARRGYHGLFVELKVGRNKPSDRQREMLDALHEQGYSAVVCYGWEEARDTITEYLEAN